MKIGSLDDEFMRMMLMLDPTMTVSQAGAILRVWRERL